MILQPVLMVNARVPGMVYVNGRLSGACGEGEPVSMPVAARGTLYLQFFPFSEGYLPLTRRMAFSSGRPVAGSVAGQRGLQLIAWPGGVVEAELSPQHVGREETVFAEAGEVRLCMRRGEDCQIELSRPGAQAVHALPSGAQPPEVSLTQGEVRLLGQTESGGQYLLCLKEEDLSSVLLSVSARRVDLESDGSVRALVDEQDQAGHARLLHWTRAQDGGYAAGPEEILWAQGAPNWPDSPENTALAALEAARLGLMDEAAGYLSPALAARECAPFLAAARADGCARMKYPMPNGRQASALLYLENENLLTCRAVYYHALPMGGAQGVWRLDALELDGEGAAQ